MNIDDLIRRGLWMFRALGRNPLIRSSDRVEATVMALALITVVLLTPLACTVGTAVHETQVAHRAAILAHRHQVTAQVTADSTATAPPAAADATTPVQWTIGSVTHTGVVTSRDWHRVGDTVRIWVDDNNLLSTTPPGSADPALAAVLATLGLWSGAAATAAVLVMVVRWHLNRRRYKSWAEEYRQLPDNRGRHWRR